mmetsp:Transcript_27937/g.65224  ORF Transcript_27937/g.65224 Transcript_27937/m.65224 type:complete len:212 (-) Transcript_27937:741-1376(-)
MSAPRKEPPPSSALASDAPLLSASPMSASRSCGFFSSGSGVIDTPSSHGSPTCSVAMRSRILRTNASATASCTMMSLIAVHRCPLYDSAPSAHCAAAVSRSASGRTMPRFLPSSCANTFRRCGCGCALISASAALEPPMNPSTSTSPVPMIGPIVARPEPETKLITPRGRCFANASHVRTCTRPPIAGSLRTAVLPMSSAGINMAYISLSG